MMRARALAALAAAGVVGSMLVSSPAIAGADVSAPATVRLSGLLRVVPGEPGVVHDAVRGEPAPPAVPGEDRVTLVTDDGSRVDLSRAALDGAASGVSFTGTVAVPAVVAADVGRTMRAEGMRRDAADAAELVAEAAQTRAVPLAVLDATVGRPQTAAAGRVHTVDVVWYGRAGIAAPSDGDVNAMLARLSEYWTSQSGGQVASVTRPLPIRRADVTWDPCDADAAWTHASAAFGHPETYYWAEHRARHLVVLVPASLCGGGGLGTEASSIDDGGLIHAEIPVASPVDWDQVVFHEFGHNLTLLHSSARVCDEPIVDSAYDTAQGRPANAACSDVEYEDYYDVMGGGYTFYDSDDTVLASSSRNVAALDVTHATRLGALVRGSSLRVVDLAAGDVQTLTVGAISGTSGVRGLEVIDPRTQERVYVEYRSGTGRDAKSMYAVWQAAVGDDEYAPGVRVLRSYSCAACGSASSTVLQRFDADGQPRMWLGPGDSLRTYDGAVRVEVVSTSAASATVRITLDDGRLKFTTKPTPALAVEGGGVAYYGRTLTVSGAGASSWAPAPTSVAIQWLRDGSPIAGATRSGYRVTGADIGRQLAVRVTATRSGYTTTAVVSATVRPGGPTTSRVSGASRYETAVQVSKAAFPSTAPVVYLATGTNYPDALAAAPAAATAGGPLLLVPSSGAVPKAVLDRVAQLAPARIVAVGGTGAVSAAVVSQVAARAPKAKVTRLAGANRYETGRKVVADAFPRQVAQVFVATGRNYPDALSASAVAGGRDVPVILVDGALPRLDAATLALLARLAPARATVVGGTGAVSAGIQSQLAARYPTERLAGASRYETSAAIDDASFAAVAVPVHYWATGTDFADALSGSVLAAVRGAPLYVVQPTCVPPQVAVAIGRKTTAAVTLIGGEGALGKDVAALKTCG